MTDLLPYNLDTQPSLGIAEYSEVEEFVADQGGDDTRRLWGRLASLSRYAAGENVAGVGRLTPRNRDGLEPFIFKPEDGAPIVEEFLVVDGLYRYMSHPEKIIVYGFGQAKQDTVNGFLNHRIEETLAD